MRIPSRVECERLLQKHNFPQRKRRHVEIVTKVATFLGKRLSSYASTFAKATVDKKASEDKKVKSKKVNLDLIYAGGMLHDIDKGIEGAGEVHPQKAVEILLKEGYPEVARICETHTINAFLNPKTIPVTWEEKCVALADKMVKDEVIGVDARFKLWNEENLPEEQKTILKKSYPLVKKLEEEIFGMMGININDIKNNIE